MRLPIYSRVSIVCSFALIVFAFQAPGDVAQNRAEESQFRHDVQAHFSSPTKKGLIRVLIVAEHGGEISNLDAVERYIQSRLNILTYKPGEMSQEKF